MTVCKERRLPVIELVKPITIKCPNQGSTLNCAFHVILNTYIIAFKAPSTVEELTGILAGTYTLELGKSMRKYAITVLTDFVHYAGPIIDAPSSDDDDINIIIPEAQVYQAANTTEAKLEDPGTKAIVNCNDDEVTISKPPKSQCVNELNHKMEDPETKVDEDEKDDSRLKPEGDSDVTSSDVNSQLQNETPQLQPNVDPDPQPQLQPKSNTEPANEVKYDTRLYQSQSEFEVVVQFVITEIMARKGPDKLIQHTKHSYGPHCNFLQKGKPGHEYFIAKWEETQRNWQSVTYIPLPLLTTSSSDGRVKQSGFIPIDHRAYTINGVAALALFELYWIKAYIKGDPVATRSERDLVVYTTANRLSVSTKHLNYILTGRIYSNITQNLFRKANEFGFVRYVPEKSRVNSHFHKKAMVKPTIQLTLDNRLLTDEADYRWFKNESTLALPAGVHDGKTAYDHSQQKHSNCRYILRKLFINKFFANDVHLRKYKDRIVRYNAASDIWLNYKAVWSVITCESLFDYIETDNTNKTKQMGKSFLAVKDDNNQHLYQEHLYTESKEEPVDSTGVYDVYCTPVEPVEISGERINLQNRNWVDRRNNKGDLIKERGERNACVLFLASLGLNKNDCETFMYGIVSGSYRRELRQSLTTISTASMYTDIDLLIKTRSSIKKRQNQTKHRIPTLIKLRKKLLSQTLVCAQECLKAYEPEYRNHQAAPLQVKCAKLVTKLIDLLEKSNTLASLLKRSIGDMVDRTEGTPKKLLNYNNHPHVLSFNDNKLSWQRSWDIIAKRYDIDGDLASTNGLTMEKMRGIWSLLRKSPSVNVQVLVDRFNVTKWVMSKIVVANFPVLLVVHKKKTLICNLHLMGYGQGSGWDQLFQSYQKECESSEANDKIVADYITNREKARKKGQTKKPERGSLLAPKRKRGRTAFHELYPDLVQVVTDYIKQHSFCADYHRRSTSIKSNGVSLPDIQAHVIKTVPGLKNIDTRTIARLMLPPVECTQQSKRYFRLIDAGVPKKNNSGREYKPDFHHSATRAKLVNELCCQFPDETVHLSGDAKAKLGVGNTPAVGSTHHLSRVFHKSAFPLTPDHNYIKATRSELTLGGWLWLVHLRHLTDVVEENECLINSSDRLESEQKEEPNKRGPRLSQRLYKTVLDPSNRPHVECPKSGPVFLTLRSDRFAKYGLEPNLRDLEVALGHIKQYRGGKELGVLTVTVDGGGDYLIGSRRNVFLYFKFFKKHGFDVFNVKCYCGGMSAYNLVEHVWAVVSRALVGVMLPYWEEGDPHKQHPETIKGLSKEEKEKKLIRVYEKAMKIVKGYLQDKTYSNFDIATVVEDIATSIINKGKDLKVRLFWDEMLKVKIPALKKLLKKKKKQWTDYVEEYKLLCRHTRQCKHMLTFSFCLDNNCPLAQCGTDESKRRAKRFCAMWIKRGLKFDDPTPNPMFIGHNYTLIELQRLRADPNTDFPYVFNDQYLPSIDLVNNGRQDNIRLTSCEGEEEGICRGKTFLSQIDQKMHMWIVHGVTLTNKSLLVPTLSQQKAIRLAVFTCSYCGENFQSNAYRTVHTKKEQKNNPNHVHKRQGNAYSKKDTQEFIIPKTGALIYTAWRCSWDDSAVEEQNVDDVMAMCGFDRCRHFFHSVCAKQMLANNKAFIYQGVFRCSVHEQDISVPVVEKWWRVPANGACLLYAACLPFFCWSMKKGQQNLKEAVHKCTFELSSVADDICDYNDLLSLFTRYKILHDPNILLRSPVVRQLMFLIRQALMNDNLNFFPDHEYGLGESDYLRFAHLQKLSDSTGTSFDLMGEPLITPKGGEDIKMVTPLRLLLGENWKGNHYECTGIKSLAVFLSPPPVETGLQQSQSHNQPGDDHLLNDQTEQKYLPEQKVTKVAGKEGKQQKRRNGKPEQKANKVAGNEGKQQNGRNGKNKVKDPSTCSNCGEIFTSSYFRRIHLNTEQKLDPKHVHKKKKKKRVEDKRPLCETPKGYIHGYVCLFCNKIFASPRFKSKHLEKEAKRDPKHVERKVPANHTSTKKRSLSNEKLQHPSKKKRKVNHVVSNKKSAKPRKDSTETKQKTIQQQQKKMKEDNVGRNERREQKVFEVDMKQKRDNEIKEAIIQDALGLVDNEDESVDQYGSPQPKTVAPKQRSNSDTPKLSRQKVIYTKGKTTKKVYTQQMLTTTTQLKKSASQAHKSKVVQQSKLVTPKRLTKRAVQPCKPIKLTLPPKGLSEANDPNVNEYNFVRNILSHAIKGSATNYFCAWNVCELNAEEYKKNKNLYFKSKPKYTNDDGVTKYPVVFWPSWVTFKQLGSSIPIQEYSGEILDILASRGTPPDVQYSVVWSKQSDSCRWEESDLIEDIMMTVSAIEKKIKGPHDNHDFYSPPKLPLLLNRPLSVVDKQRYNKWDAAFNSAGDALHCFDVWVSASYTDRPKTKQQAVEFFAASNWPVNKNEIRKTIQRYNSSFGCELATWKKMQIKFGKRIYGDLCRLSKKSVLTIDHVLHDLVVTKWIKVGDIWDSDVS